MILFTVWNHQRRKTRQFVKPLCAHVSLIHPRNLLIHQETMKLKQIQYIVIYANQEYFHAVNIAPIVISASSSSISKSFRSYDHDNIL